MIAQLDIDDADTSEFIVLVGPFNIQVEWRPWAELMPDLEAWAAHNDMTPAQMVRCTLEKELYELRLHREAAS